MAYKNFLGFERGENGQPVINEEQATLVRRIYSMFIDGKTVSAIAKALTADHVPTPGGRKLWQPSVIESILTNEKYKGDALLQKTYCADFLTKKMKKNQGEVPQYYVEGSHPAIVSPELFDHVQWELQRRKGMGSIPSTSCFAGRIVCGDCGSVYGSKVWHSTSKYRRVIWQCNGKFKGEKKCSTPHLYEKDLQQAFLRFVNGLITDRDNILEGLKEALAFLTDNAALEKERDALREECEVVMELMHKMVRENARLTQDQRDYNARYSAMTERYDKANTLMLEVSRKIDERNAKRYELEAFMKTLCERDELLTVFDEGLWLSIVHQVKVTEEGEFEFVLKNESEFTSS